MASTKGIPLSKVSPAFLHANSTSHTWIFSAFAELIDNAYDPDVSASELLIDKVDIRGVPCLIFLDNGAGIDTDHLLRMLSFGFCEKDIYEKQGSHQPIGHYGNGFKSGSMRIGNDALVFTRCRTSASIGFLSQTYLKSIQADSVMVPILEYRLPKLERIKSQESRNNLNAILEYSVFKTESELKEELKALEGSKTGTKIIIYNIKRLQDGTCELDFSSDPTDIRCPDAHETDRTSVYNRPIQHKSAEYKRSLREYCSILYLRPRMKITIRGVRVKSRLISKSLSNTEIDVYKPTWLSRSVKIIFGFTCETQRPEDCDYGMMLYHRNRLIKAFEKVGSQKHPNGVGVGVVGVAQVDFLQPIHNKQDFNKDEKYNSVMAAFANKLNDYWKEKKGSEENVQPDVGNLPDWTWAQCEHCLKWRRLPDEIDRNPLPDIWYCRMNPDATHNRCDIPEEPEDEDLAVKPTYLKTFKKKQEERKKLQQLEKEKEEDIKRRKIMEKEQELKEKEATLRAIEQVATVKPLQEMRTVLSLQRALVEARRREEQQKRLILEMQDQKNIMEEQRNSLLNFAETLKSSEGKDNKELLQHMSQLLSKLNPQSVLPSPVSGKRKSSEESLKQNRKGRKKKCIQTEQGEMLSMTENETEEGDEDLDTDHCLPTLSPNQDNGPKQNTQSAQDEIDKKSSAIPSSTQHETNLPVASSSKTPSTQNVKQSAMAALSLESVTETPTIPSKSGRKHKRKDTVVAVIDLTSESEFGELIDVKPSVDELRTTLQDSLHHEMAEVKPDKDALVLSSTDGHDKGNEADPTFKEEIIETALQNMSSVPSLNVSGPERSDNAVSDKETGKSGIHFGPSEDDPEFMMGISESFQENLEAAMTAIHDRMKKTKYQQEIKNPHSASVTKKNETVLENEMTEEDSKEKAGCNGKLGRDKMTVTKLKNKMASSESVLKIMLKVNKNVRKGNKKKKNQENKNVTSLVTLKDQNCDNDDSDFACDSPIDDSRDCSAVDEKTNTCEPHLGQQKCSGISERSNSYEENGEGSSHCIDTDGESSVMLDYAVIQHEKQCKIIDTEHNSSDSIVNEPNKETHLAVTSDDDGFEECSDNIVRNSHCNPIDTMNWSHSSVNHSSSQLKHHISTEKVVAVGGCRKVKDSIQNGVKNNVSHDKEGKLELGDKTLLSKSKRTSDQFVQTDLDMAAVKEVFKLNEESAFNMCNQDVHNRKELLVRSEKTDKIIQTHDLKDCNDTAVQTEVWSSLEDLVETQKELHIKLSLKTQLLETVEGKLTETCVNIHKLLGFIVPGAELGDVCNIDEVIKNMVKLSEESGSTFSGQQ